MQLSTRSILLALVITLVSNLGFSQNTLDLSASAGTSFRLSKNGTFGRALNDWDSPGFAYRLGGDYSIKLNAQTALSIGGHYAALSTRTVFEADNLQWGSQWNDSVFDPSIPSGEEFPSSTFIDRKHLIEAPISIRRYTSEKNRFYVHLGLIPSLHFRYAVTRKQEGKDNETQTDTFTDFQSFQLAAKTGVGMDWPLAEKLKLFSQVNGQIHLLEEVEDSGLRWWDVSLQAGLRLGL